ncbi:MAG: glutamate racemase [Flavobacteriaceae bacterium]|nr:MAG: glutamate racemase [Flavobacteriaceae bacterium]
MSPTHRQPIGIFDSGIGGISILKEITLAMPNEHTIYLSDSANAPYGEKSKEEIIQLSKKNTEYLLNKDCKMIVVACNTATTNAIETLRKEYNVPFIGIEPAIKPAALKTTTNVVGILATKGTLNSTLFAQTSSTINKKISMVEQIGEGLVELIEKGEIQSEKMTQLLRNYVGNLIQKNADCIVLGCTHYSYLIPQIRKIVTHGIHIIDAGEAVAKQTKNILLKHNLLNVSTAKKAKNQVQVLINKNSDVLRNIILEHEMDCDMEETFF